MVSRAWFDRPVVTLQSPPILADIAAAQGHNNLWCDTPTATAHPLTRLQKKKAGVDLQPSFKRRLARCCCQRPELLCVFSVRAG